MSEHDLKKILKDEIEWLKEGELHKLSDSVVRGICTKRAWRLEKLLNDFEKEERRKHR